MAKALKVVAVVVVAGVAVTALTVALFRQQNEESRIGCAMSPDCATTTTTSSRVASVIADQTTFYERAGLTHTEAACLANVTGRMTAPKGAKYVVLGTHAQDDAIDECNINPKRLAKVGPYTDKHPPSQG